MPGLVDELHKLKCSLMTGCVFGNAFISMLPAGMEIAEHRGISNTRLRVHLGVEVANLCEDTCYMLVGKEVDSNKLAYLSLATRLKFQKLSWTTGRCVIFDDSFSLD